METEELEKEAIELAKKVNKLMYECEKRGITLSVSCFNEGLFVYPRFLLTIRDNLLPE